MKSEKELSYRKYPYLGSYNGYVVLFTKPKSGFYVYIPEDDPDVTLGDYAENFVESCFSIFDGKIILEN